MMMGCAGGGTVGLNTQQVVFSLLFISRLVCVRVVLLELAISYIDSILKVFAYVKNFASYKEMCLRVIVS